MGPDPVADSLFPMPKQAPPARQGCQMQMSYDFRRSDRVSSRVQDGAHRADTSYAMTC